MIIVDTALEKLAQENKPIRVGMVGAGAMATGTLLTLHKYTKGIKVVAISNRTLDKAIDAYKKAGNENIVVVNTKEELNSAINNGDFAVTTEAINLCSSDEIDVILEMTGNVEFGAKVALETFKNKKHFVTFNAELIGTLGAILQVYAEKAGVICTLADGDQPGVQMNLIRFVKGIGITPVLIGNIKGLHDPYRNPTTQEGFAKTWKQNVRMVTSFADGAKISFEQAVVANAIGAKVLKRGMTGPVVETGTKIEESVNWYPTEQLLSGEVYVDYVVGAHPAPGVFVLGTISDSVQEHFLKLYKLGDGPLYCFYVPYHLCHFEVGSSIARAQLFNDPTLASKGAPTVHVVAVAKKDIVEGEQLDGIGGYMSYGICVNADDTAEHNLLPIGLSDGCKVKRSVKKDALLTFDDVEFPKDSLALSLWNEQKERFGV